jgi:hypothetical protein
MPVEVSPDVSTEESTRQPASLLDAAYIFEQQPDPIPARLRPERRVPLLLLLVAKCHGARAGWKSLHVLNWAIRDERNITVLGAVRTGRDVPDRPVVRFEPALDRAMDLAAGLGFLDKSAARVFKLTESGKEFVDAITASGAFAKERALLDQIGGRFTQKETELVLNWRNT